MNNQSKQRKTLIFNTFKQLPKTTFRAFPALLMPAILLFGIYGGVTTPTEAAAIAALYALFLTGILYRSISIKSLFEILVDSARSSAAVGVVIGGAFILNYIVISENIPGFLTTFLQGLDVSPIVFLIFINILILLIILYLYILL